MSRFPKRVTREEVKKWKEENSWPVDRIPDVFATLDEVYEVLGDHIFATACRMREGKVASRRQVEWSAPESILYLLMALESESDWRRSTRREAETVLEQGFEKHACCNQAEIHRNRGGSDDHPWLLELGVEYVEITSCPFCGKRLPEERK